MRFVCIAAGALMLAFGAVSGVTASPITPGAAKATADAAMRGSPLVLAQRRDARPYRGGTYRGRTLGRSYGVHRGTAFRGRTYGGRGYYRPSYRTTRPYYGRRYSRPYTRRYYRGYYGASRFYGDRGRYYRRYGQRPYRYYGDRGRYYRRYDGRRYYRYGERASRRYSGNRGRYDRRNRVQPRVYRDRDRYERARRQYYRRYGDRARRYYGDRGRTYRRYGDRVYRRAYRYRDGGRYYRQYRRGYWHGYGRGWQRAGHRFKDRRLKRIVRKRDFHRGRFHHIYWDYGPRYGWWFGYPLYLYNWAGYGCHQVRLYDDWGGREALIGGTVCYDELGYPYLYRRWLIRYVD